MKRVICHWTAGSHSAGDTDRDAYHILVEGNGRLVRGRPSIALNSGRVKPGYAAHTLNCNGGSIGVSLCCMAGAEQRPFRCRPLSDDQGAVGRDGRRRRRTLQILPHQGHAQNGAVACRSRE
ncbi:N-acetylmuramoyl-L-alanine amidase [Mesorhizobium sp. M0959]